MCDHKEIIDYWFTGNEFRKFWFKKDKNVDRYIKKKFGNLLEKAENNEINEWKKKPQSYLSLIIILDQFSRNIYRDNLEKIKKNDKICLQLCKDLIKKKYDNQLSFCQKAFLLLPFRHSKELSNVFYSIKQMNFYRKQELMDKNKIIIFNKFINASFNDIKMILIKKNLLINNNGKK